MSVPVWLRAVPDGVCIDVLAAPRASRSRVVGEHDGRLRVQLAAPPVDGEANDELVRFMAATLGTARSAVRVISGATSRRKVLHVVGLTPEAVAERVMFHA